VGLREDIREALARAVGRDPTSLTVEVTRVKVPGFTVFSAWEAGGRHRWTGVWDGAEVDLDRERATARVLAALGWGPGVAAGARRAPARDVAAAAGVLEDNPGAPFVDAEAIRVGGDPTTMSPPAETTVDGYPAVEFWNSSSRTGTWKSVLVFPPGRPPVSRRFPAGTR